MAKTAKKETVTIDLDNATLFQMFDYLCSKVDWGKSWLDADAVVCMNTLFKELRNDTRIIKP